MVPGLVVLATDSDEVQAVVALCHELGVPFVARGSGTGLSGGALPHSEGVLVVLSQMRRILDVDPVAQRAVVQPGVINLDVTAAAKPHGYYYAPDPSSQQICSIGGNVAENSGGAHCLEYGFTTNHVLSVELVAPDGSRTRLGTTAPDAPGYDLLGTVIGSEGTLGVVTEATLKLTQGTAERDDPSALQVTAAGQAGLDPALMAAANSSGGVLGKMVSPQNLAIAAAAVGMTGREGDLFRKVVGWSLGFLALMCLLVLGQTTVLAWMLP